MPGNLIDGVRLKPPTEALAVPGGFASSVFFSGAVRAQKAAQLFERGFNSGGLSWLTPSLGTVDALAPIDALPPNLREEMCGGHRRKPPSEENDEEEPANGDDSSQALLALNPPNGKFVLSSTALIAPEPIVVFTGPPDNPDKVEQVVARAKGKGKKAKGGGGKKKAKVKTAGQQ